MRILNIMNVWNEIDYISLRKSYCDQNNLELYVVDNMSDDGTWEYLQDNNIPSHRFDTNGAFHLTKLQTEVVRTTHEQKLTTNDWVMYSGCDQFTCIDHNIYEWLENIGSHINVIHSQLMSMFNTGEEPTSFDPVNTYFYGNILSNPREFVHKYSENYRYFADDLKMSGKKRAKLPGITINYGQTKSAEERQSTLARRKQAWRQGLPKAWGGHYKKGVERKWKWDRTSLIDIRETQYKSSIDNLRELSRQNANTQDNTSNMG